MKCSLYIESLKKYRTSFMSRIMRKYITHGSSSNKVHFTKRFHERIIMGDGSVNRHGEQSHEAYVVMSRPYNATFMPASVYRNARCLKQRLIYQLAMQ